MLRFALLSTATVQERYAVPVCERTPTDAGAPVT